MVDKKNNNKDVYGACITAPIGFLGLGGGFALLAYKYLFPALENVFGNAGAMVITAGVMCGGGIQAGWVGMVSCHSLWSCCKRTYDKVVTEDASTPKKTASII